MIQDKYDLADVKKLRKAMRVYYPPNSEKRLSERKIREILETQKDTLSLDRIETLQKYLNLTTKMSLFPTQNETKEEWLYKLVVKNNWQHERHKDLKHFYD